MFRKICLFILIAGCDRVDDGDPWADAVESFDPDPESHFNHDDLPEIVLGPPGGSLDVVSLGCEGSIVLRFDPPGVVGGDGEDLRIFENPFSVEFPEPGEVEVSEDGETWLRFPCDPVALLGCAGVSPGGDGFDLAELGLSEASYVRITDRSREYWASVGQDYCDPGQAGAGGFDLDAAEAVHGGE